MPSEIERLYREHRAGLVRLVERELHDHHDAEDVVQTAFIDAQRALERGTIPHNPRAWLAAIALNAGRRLRRRRLNAEPLEEYAVEAAGMPEIRSALASLPREQRAAVVYRDLLGLSYGETAQEMGTSVNSVTMLLHRGRRRLRQTLALTAGAVGLWRWLRRAGMPQVAVAKSTAAVVVATGLATTGVVAARVIAPIGSEAAAAAPVARVGDRMAEAGRTHGGVAALHSTRRQHETAGGARASTAPVTTQDSSGDATPASGPSSTPGAASTRSPSTLPVPTVSLPTLPTPTTPTSPVTVSVSTPITTVAVTTPTVTTSTVSTPITTVTLPIP